MIPELLDVLRECMGGTLPSETAYAWTTLYDIIGSTSILYRWPYLVLYRESYPNDAEKQSTELSHLTHSHLRPEMKTSLGLFFLQFIYFIYIH